MVRIRENFRLGRTQPTEKVFEKGMRNKVKLKRNFSEDGTSRPWDVSELEGE
jgi:hypothetical protein